MLLARRLLPAARTAAWLQRQPPVVTTVQRNFAKKKKKGKGKQPAEAAPATDDAVDIFADAFDSPLIAGLDKTVAQLESTLKTMRGGDVNAELFDACAVEAYGDRQPLSTVAHVAVASPTLVRISCFDPQLAPAVAKAVADIEGLGLNPNVSGGDVVVPIPRPSKEQRGALAKAAGAAAEEAKKRARNHRRDAHDRLKKASGGVSEDDVRAKKSAIDELVDEASKKITKLADEKKRAIETRQD
jgi:ribosome recycling factor